MTNISQRHQNILLTMLKTGVKQSSEILREFARSGIKISLPTVKRTLAEMSRMGFLRVLGQGRSTQYEVTTPGRMFCHIDASAYCDIEPDQRYGQGRYHFDLFASWPEDIFDDQELKLLEDASKMYHQRSKNISKTLQIKELERLVIELSWKSSKIEGNTYTLLDTENLILRNKEAPGHDRSEARMILNHKEAFYFIQEHTKEYRSLTRTNLENLHAIMMQGLNVQKGLRKGPVGVTGSKYQPLDNIYQIQEAVEMLATVVKKVTTPYAKALSALLGVSYIQPFDDGNKRSARLMANAVLLAYDCAPLSYRSVDEQEYRSAMLVFYELNSIVPLKKIFIEQYQFAATHYAL